MAVTDHPSYQEEYNRLQYTLDLVKENLRQSTEKHERIGQSFQNKRYFKSDNSQDFIDMMINQQIYSALSLKLRNLQAAQKKPYFARIDFREADKEKADPLYIGKVSLIEEKTQQTAIIDWRAPIANLYYEGRLGPSRYQAPGGEIPGELVFKRQYTIDDAQLKAIYDIDITTNDELLQMSLGANAENRLKDIVATIQEEQNRIIRAAADQPLIVQGVAGSGKTTVALHRIAYLIYNLEHDLKPENFMIIAPNRLFLDYISEVLPELGVENVKQTTFEDLAQEWIGTRLKFPDTFEKLRLLIGDGERPLSPEEKERIEAIARFKSSLRFKEILDAYIDHIEHNLLPAEDFAQGRWVVYTQEEIADLFFREYQHWPILKRLDQLKKHFNKRLKEQKDAIAERLQRECNQRSAWIRQSMPETEERRQRILSLIDRKDAAIRAAAEFAKNGAKAFIAKIPVQKPLEYYRAFFSEPQFFLKFASDIDPELRTAVRDSTLALMDRKMVDAEDLAPLIYLKSRLHGLDDKVRIKHAVIDEAQDFSLFQFLMLKSVMKDGSFTILGDLNQGIHAYRAIERWEDVQEKVFGVDHSHMLTLEQCYRTTVEVMEAANRVIQKHPEAALARPVIRHGEPVRIIHKESAKAIAADIAAKIRELRGEELLSFAIICKTLRGARKFLQAYPKEEEMPTLITGKEKAYYGGVVAVSSYLAKGLEFDAVFIPDADREVYGEEALDIKLFYVAMTRPLHKLYIYHSSELTGLLDEVPHADG